jgi:hypothetical protein
MRSRASSTTSSKFSVVISASDAPLRWMTVLMPTGGAVDEARDVGRADAVPFLQKVEAAQQLGAGRLRRGQDLQAVQLLLRLVPQQKSMKVPPISTPTRMPMSTKSSCFCAFRL